MTDVQTSDIAAVEVETAPGRRIGILSVRQLMWRKFRRNRLAVFGAVVLVVMYLMAAFAPFVAPYDVRETHQQYPRTPPSTLHFFDDKGQFHFPPFVYTTTKAMDPKTFAMTVKEDTSTPYPIRFLARGTPYVLFGFIKGDVHPGRTSLPRPPVTTRTISCTSSIEVVSSSEMPMAFCT